RRTPRERERSVRIRQAVEAVTAGREAGVAYGRGPTFGGRLGRADCRCAKGADPEQAKATCLVIPPEVLDRFQKAHGRPLEARSKAWAVIRSERVGVDDARPDAESLGIARQGKNQIHVFAQLRKTVRGYVKTAQIDGLYITKKLFAAPLHCGR